MFLFLFLGGGQGVMCNSDIYEKFIPPLGFKNWEFFWGGGFDPAPPPPLGNFSQFHIFYMTAPLRKGVKEREFIVVTKV